MIIVPARPSMLDGWDEIQYLMSIINMDIRRGRSSSSSRRRPLPQQDRRISDPSMAESLVIYKRGAYTESFGISP